MGRRSRYVVAIMAFALVLVACGSSDGGSFLDQSPGATSAADGLIPIGDLPTDVGNLPGVSGECEALLNLFLSISGAFLGGEVPGLDAAALADLPGDVRADAQIVSDALRDFSVGLQDMGINLADPASFATMTEAQQAAFEDLTASLDSDQFNTASDNLSAYGDQQCEDQFGPVG